MATIDQVARAFVEGRAAKCHNAQTDGASYYLHGHEIAKKLEGEVQFDWCGWYTPTTRSHMNAIMDAGSLGRHVSASEARKAETTTFTVAAAWAKAAPEATEGGHKKPTARYHRYDAWRGHAIPRLAVAGASDTGTWEDSPCPSDKVEAEVSQFQQELAKLGVRSKVEFGETSNVFCAKRWVTVRDADFERAAQFAVDWLAEHKYDTRFMHDADQGQLGYTPTKKETA